MKKVGILSVLLSAGLLQACAPSSSGDAGGTPVTEQFCSASLDASPFFTDAPVANNKADKKGLRQRSVSVDIKALKKALRQKNKQVNLDLFHDQNVPVVIEDVTTDADQNVVVTGKIQDDENSAVTLAVQDDVVVGHIHKGTGSVYEISYQGTGVHSIDEMQDLEDHECVAESAPAVAEDVEATATTEQTEEVFALAATPMIDMLVVYTPAAASKAGGASAIKALIQTGIADTNKAFANSGVNLTVRLVGVMAMSQNESGDFSSDLGKLQGKTDGKWDSVHAERTRLGADQVTLVGSYPNNSVAGIGYIKSSASTAFAIAKVSAFSAYTFTHELGHNIGLQHSDGYVNSSGGFRTVMAYGSYPRIRRFSNPSLTYNGYKTGDSDQNSSSKLNNYGGSTSALLAMKVPLDTGNTGTPTETPSVPSETQDPIACKE